MDNLRTISSTTKIGAMLRELTATVDHDPALNNAFYDTWLGSALPLDAVVIFARNYGHWVWEFPHALNGLVKRTENPEIQAELKKTLRSEMGNGRAEKAHRLLLHEFIQALSAQLGSKEPITREWLVKNIPLLETSKKLVDREFDLYGEQSHARAVGAQLALEWHAFSMIMKLYEGARSYIPVFETQRSFHEAAEYFYAHLGEAEKDHKVESLNAAEMQICSEGELVELKDGYFEHLALIRTFWEGIAAEIAKKCRKKHAFTH